MLKDIVTNLLKKETIYYSENEDSFGVLHTTKPCSDYDLVEVYVTLDGDNTPNYSKYCIVMPIDKAQKIQSININQWGSGDANSCTLNLYNGTTEIRLFQNVLGETLHKIVGIKF